MSAIEATTAGFKDMADGTLRLLFDVEPRHADEALRLFRERGRSAALAALMHAHEQPAPEPKPEAPKGGERAKWAAIRCKDADFQRWLCNTFENEWNSVLGNTSEEIAASVVRSVCAVGSRIDFDIDKHAGIRFDVLIRKAWQEHCGVTA